MNHFTPYADRKPADRTLIDIIVETQVLRLRVVEYTVAGIACFALGFFAAVQI